MNAYKRVDIFNLEQLKALYDLFAHVCDFILLLLHIKSSALIVPLQSHISFIGCAQIYSIHNMTFIVGAGVLDRRYKAVERKSCSEI